VEEYTLSEVEVTTVSYSMEHVFVSEAVSKSTVVYSLTETKNSAGDRREHTVAVVSYFVSLTVAVSYRPIVLPFITRTQSYVKIQAQERPTTPPEEADNAVIIGISSGVGILVAIMAGVAVFLLRSARGGEGGDSIDFRDLEAQRTIRRNTYEGVAPEIVESSDVPEADLKDLEEWDIPGDDDLENIASNDGCEEIWI
jgi:hypothetical protein